MRIRVLPLSLAIFFLLVFVLCPALQQANALVGIDDALIAVIIAALAGVGIAFSSTGGYQSVKAYVESLMQEYAESLSTTPEAQLRGSRTGSNNLGQIIVNNRLLLYIDTFAQWVKLKLGLSNNSSEQVVAPGASLGQLTVYVLPLYFTQTISGSYYNKVEYYVNGNSTVLWVPTTNNRSLFVSESQFVVTILRKAYHNNVLDGQYSINCVGSKEDGVISGGLSTPITNPAYYYSIIEGGDLPFTSDGFSAVRNDVTLVGQTLSSPDQSIVVTDGIGVDTGVILPPSDDTDYVPGDGGVIDVDADWGTPFDVIVGQVIPDAVIDGTIGDTVITYDGEDAVQDQVTDVGGTTVSSNPGDYQVSGIASVFPFCIPFDVYNFLTVLDAEPEAPHFQWRFKVPGVYDGTIDIDLAPFNGVAQVLRTAELLLFIVGLAVVTRNRFIRS